MIFRTIIRRAIAFGRRSFGATQPLEGHATAARLKNDGKIVMGEACSISPRTVITDPSYLVLGNNVRLADCHLFGHDGSINMVNRAVGAKFDSVGKIVIGSNVFIGHGAIVLPNTEIGDDVIIGAGSVVKGKVPGGYVYIGVPARPVETFAHHVEKVKRRQDSYPVEWRRLLSKRAAEFDPALEAPLVEIRRKHFFG